MDGGGGQWGGRCLGVGCCERQDSEMARAGILVWVLLLSHPIGAGCTNVMPKGHALHGT